MVEHEGVVVGGGVGVGGSGGGGGGGDIGDDGDDGSVSGWDEEGARGWFGSRRGSERAAYVK